MYSVVFFPKTNFESSGYNFSFYIYIYIYIYKERKLHYFLLISGGQWNIGVFFLIVYPQLIKTNYIYQLNDFIIDFIKNLWIIVY